MAALARYTQYASSELAVRRFIRNHEERMMEQLKAGPSIHVRKSAANNLNDISKTHPDIVVILAKEWYGSMNIRIGL